MKKAYLTDWIGMIAEEWWPAAIHVRFLYQCLYRATAKHIKDSERTREVARFPGA